MQAGSTLTIHDVSCLGNPDKHLAKAYSASLEGDLAIALDAKRFDHAEVFATLQGLLADPPPPYSRLPPLERVHEVRQERRVWEQAMARRKLVLDRM